MAIYNETLVETLSLQPVEAGNLITSQLAEETIHFSYRLEEIYQQLVTISEGLGLEGPTSALIGVVLVEHLRLSPQLLVNEISNITVAETMGLLDRLLPGFPVTIVEGLGLAVTQAIQQAVTVIEDLGLSETLLSATTYNLNVEERLGLAENLATFFGAEVIEGLGLQSALIGNKLITQELVETVGIAGTLVGNLIAHVTVEESLGLEGVDLLNAIYSGTIVEGLGLSLAYASPDGGFTTWAMNTRTAAVTEYSNYDKFNSFARLGNRYIGAASDGLYELMGDDDEGEDIIARIKSGFAQWAGSRFTLFKAAYLGVRGEGDFVLKLITGEGKEYIYAVATRDMRSTKVKIGKGLRSRYFRFELISTGQDFDLESIEFVPLVAQRRV